MNLTNSSEGSLLEHLDALRGTLLWCLGSVVLCAVPGIIFAPDLLLRYVKFVCPPGMEMHYFTPFEPLIVELELGLLAGLFCALPFILYKIGKFAAPGLYQHERRWVFWFVLVSVLLMLAGAALSLCVVVPIVMQFSGTFAGDGLKPVIGLAAFLRLAGLLAAGFALVFELPAALLLAIRFRLVSVEFLRSKRPLIVVVLFVTAAILTPPDIVSQLLMGLPGWILFELTLLIGSRIVPKEEEEEEEEGSETRLYNRETSAGETELPEEYAANYVDDAPYRQAGRKKRRIRHL
jgi:sec-independent protein translocase protein TatC